MNQSLIEANDLTCMVAGQRLFDRLGLTVVSGDVLELWGPNGSGKSTLLRCLAGLFEADGGVIKRAVSLLYMGHRPGLNELLSPLENLRWCAGLQERDVSPETLLSAIHYAGLERYKDAPCRTLSAGQMRRAALARLCISESRLWLLDEPMTSLDDDAVALVRNLIAKHRSAGGGCICATHVKLEFPQTRVLELGT
ncbi:MAG TPA: heme ABC exporter ATP-binding protein CcmA [Pseudomonadales bacterium]|nr:heme ABC exporter ATP-binding protein CcmA [Pseudomonadales bacterium]